jgi:hypothetical protein
MATVPISPSPFQSGHGPAHVASSMPIKTPRPPDSPAWVAKLQILAAVLVPMVGLGIWLRSQGFW